MESNWIFQWRIFKFLDLNFFARTEIKGFEIQKTELKTPTHNKTFK